MGVEETNERREAYVITAVRGAALQSSNIHCVDIPRQTQQHLLSPDFGAIDQPPVPRKPLHV